jgi:flagellar biosynthesis/type III secretory pathway M-ring protein FliF/YscJ|tara:strand:- start:1488 stop:3026 length:1539 start_codon:yes stop_codon:yes gene_type:complete
MNFNRGKNIHMNKGANMKKRNKMGTKFVLMATLLFSIIVGQSNGYLAQKLMIENSLRNRISDAMEKVIDNRKYVIDVSVDLEVSSAIESETTFSPNEGSVQSLQSARDLVTSSDAPTSGSVGLPIPGFDFTAEAPETSAPTVSEPKMDSPVNDNVVSRTEKEMKPSMASVRNMEISIIIQEGAAPELIENIRQVVMVASRFNRPRGDVLSIMTASFKERRDEKSAEQVLLKNIAEKLETLESQRERLGEVDWKQELENYKESESERRQEDRLYFQSKLAELEASARDKSYDQERESMLRQDSVRLQALNEEIQNLKSFLGAANISDSAATEAQSSVQKKLQERSNLDSQIAEKLAMLDQAQAELDRQSGRSGGGSGMIILVSILSALVIGLIVALVFMLINKPRQQMPPPWMMYPPRRPKKKDNGAPEVVVEKKTQPSQPVEAASAPSEDIAVLQSEVNDMKQAVVSMSVGQPQAANKIVKDWILEEAPPEPEPEPATEEPDDSGGKKKKKK